MPSVPVYNRQVQQGAMPGVRVSTDAPIEAFGGNNKAFQASSQLMDVASKIALEEKKKADQLAYTSADRKLSELQTRLQVDVSKKLGKDAFAAPDYVDKEWVKGLGDIEKELTNDDQRMAFRRSVDNRWEQLNRSTQFHMADQAKKYDEQETQSYISTSRDIAKLNAHDDNAIGVELERQRARVTEWAQRNGVSGSAIEKDKLMNEVSATHREVIQSRLAAGADVMAKQYFENAKARKELTEQDLSQLEGAIREGSTRGESLRLASDIMAKYGGDMKSALAEARKVPDPDVQRATVDEIKTRFAENEAIDRQRREDRYKAASRHAERTKERPDPVTWMALDPEERVAIDNRIKQLRQGIEPETDMNVKYDLMLMASEPRLRDKFLKTNLMTYADKLNKSDLNAMMEKQAAARKGQGEDEEIKAFRTQQQIVNDSLTAAGIDISPKDGSSDAKKIEKFRRLIDEEVIRMRKEGKTPSAEDIQNITDNLLLQGVTGRSWFGWEKNKRVFELEPDEQIQIKKKDIPASEMRLIREYLRKNKMPETDEVILELYGRKLNRVGGRTNE